LRRRVRPQWRGPKPCGATQAETMTLFPRRNSAIGKMSPFKNKLNAGMLAQAIGMGPAP
jgi:hypothetical protein